MKTSFNLVTKNIGIKYRQYCGDAVRLSKQIPYTVDEIVVTNDKRPESKRKITTFRNSKGQIIERVFDFSDKPYRNRLYNIEDNVIGNDEFVTSTTTKDYILERAQVPFYKEIISHYLQSKKYIFWMNTQTETNHLSENISTGEKVLTQVRINNFISKNRQKHTFIEYPHIRDGKVDKNSAPKFLKFTIRNSNNSVIKKSIQCDGVECPKNDTYLGYRALSIDDSKELFAQRFIKEKGLEKAGIKINTEYNPINELNSDFMAIFNAEDGVVNYNKDYKIKSKSQLVNISAHEVEHAGQYCLQARYNGGGTEWQKQIVATYGPIKSEKIKEEARQYDDSINNYVPFWKDIKAYKGNLIEVLSKKKGIETQYAYDKEGEQIRKDFPHIPIELL